MPWCGACDRWLAPSAVRTDGTCPRCGAGVEHTAAPDTRAARDADALPPVPWHFKLLVGAFAVYLGYRAWQGVEWVLHALRH